MKTTHSAHTPTTDLTTLDEESIEAFFAEAGLSVTVVAHCEDAGCPLCAFSSLQRVRAA